MSNLTLMDPKLLAEGSQAIVTSYAICAPNPHGRCLCLYWMLRCGW